MGTTFVLYTTTHLSVNREQLGGLYTLNGVMIILLQYPLSRLVLRYRLSILLAIATFVRASGFLLVAAANQFYVLQIVIVALTVGEMLQAPSGSSYAASIASEDKRGEYLGFYNWAWNSGQALSPVVGGFLLGLLAPSEFGIWYIVFAVGASCSFVYVWLGKKARRVIPRLDNIL
jgi:MFS family permease